MTSKIELNLLNPQEILTNTFVELQPSFSAIVGLCLNQMPQNELLNRLEKKLEAVKVVKNALLDIDRREEKRSYKVCRMIFISLIPFDDMMDGIKHDLDTAPNLLPQIVKLKRNLKIYLTKFKYEEWQQNLIIEWVDQIVQDIYLDHRINNFKTKLDESLFQLRPGGYPSTMVGLAIGLGLIDMRYPEYFSSQVFRTLVEEVSFLARICDDLVSKPDPRNLVLDDSGQLKPELNEYMIQAAIQNHTQNINAILNSERRFSLREKEFIEAVSGFYPTYLENWRARHSQTST
ncbi:MAG: hypothetical protein OHK0017_07090 [Patescibacteria group bacterium]